jgi:hypothetical protein
VTPSRPTDSLARVRLFLLATLVLGLVGTGTELLLIGHTAELTQIIPVASIGLGLLACPLVALRSSRATVQLFRGVMGLFIVAGILGLILHYRGNVEFELEMRPTMSGWELIWNALTGATPALAPGSMVLLGLLGVLYTFRHPALGREPGEG